jgi:hypothetical protein
LCGFSLSLCVGSITNTSNMLQTLVEKGLEQCAGENVLGVAIGDLVELAGPEGEKDSVEDEGAEGVAPAFDLDLESEPGGVA